MKNSFIIKNSDSNFDFYFKQIIKRKVGQATMQLFSKPEDQTMKKYGKIAGKRPPARDGHCAIMWGDQMFVFGGDRHHMPFNDLYMLNLKN